MPGRGNGRLQRIAAFFGIRPNRPAVRGDGTLWAPGDMAECVVDGPWFNPFTETMHEPERGHVAIVRDIILMKDWSTGRPTLYLAFGRWPGKVFVADGFRKLTPAADTACAADAAFTDALKRGRVPAPTLSGRLAARLERILP